jgi:hypothetical protein
MRHASSAVSPDVVLYKCGRGGRDASTARYRGTALAQRPLRRVENMKYGVAWLLGVPTSLIALGFIANQMGCGF